MIGQKSKIRQVDAQLRASMRLLKRTQTPLVKQLGRTVHPIMSMGDVQKLVTMVEAREMAIRALFERLGPVNDSDCDAAVIALLSSPEGESLARESWRLEREIEKHIARWDENRALARQQIELYEPSPITLRDRTMAFQYSALCRQAEVHSQLLNAALDSHFLSFWDVDGKFGFNGQTEETEGESK